MSHPMYEVVTGEGLMRPCFKARPGVPQFTTRLLFFSRVEESSLTCYSDPLLFTVFKIFVL